MNRAVLAGRLMNVDRAHDAYAHALTAFIEGRVQDIEAVHTARMTYMLSLEMLARILRNELSTGPRG